MKRKVLLVVAFAVIILSAVTVLCSCGFFSDGETIVPPTVDSVEMLKDIPNYTQSNEYLFNKDSENAMPLYAGDSFLLSIKYNNTKKYAISYVTINNERVMAKQFESGSSKTNTIIKITVPKDAAKGSEVTYSLKNIFYNTGSETKKIKFGNDLKTEFTVKVSPTFTITLNRQNADYRAASTLKTHDINTSTIDFGAEMSTVGVMDVNHVEPNGLPEKAGGWVFDGWFTEPYGKGQLINSKDTYYFWNNVTLYAYFTRIFEYEIVPLETPIEDIVNGQSRKYTNGVVITKDDSRQYPKMPIDDTIVDERIITNETTGKDSLTYTEYPVIKIANKAFQDKNWLTEISIGKYVTEIGAYAFDNCNKAEKVTFNSGSRLQYIGDFAFQDTKVMGITTAFTLPETVTYLGNFAFRYSGWRITNNNGINESVLHIKPQYTFIGASCFFDTGFDQVVFEAGCHFESQIPHSEAQDIEKAAGWLDFRPEQNRIGSNLFANCKNLRVLRFESDNEDANAINIIPDRCFDAYRYTINKIETLIWAEGIVYIGDSAFSYQEKLTVLEIPASVEEIGQSAFYNCSSVTSLTFKEGSQLRILHSRCFGNLAKEGEDGIWQGIDRVVINSAVFEKYGNGPFEGCKRLKGIEFPNLNDPELIPKGYERNENRDEVLAQHKYSDFLFGTFESSPGESGSATDKTNSGYATPVRVFCRETVMEQLKQSFLDSKATYYFSNGEASTTIAGPSQFRNTVFVHNIDLVMTYTNPGASTGEKAEVSIALQEIYSGRSANSKNVIGYSLVYWSERSKNIVLPDKIDGLTKDIIELAMYALPTSVTNLTIPSNFVRLEHDALNGCYNLEEVNFTDVDTLEYIGDYAFCGTKINSFVGGASLRVIGEAAFKLCRSLKWVDLSNTAIVNETTDSGNTNRDMYITQYKYDYEVEENSKYLVDHNNGMFDGAFQGCISLNWVYLPKKLQQLSNATFFNCSRLTTLICDCQLKTLPDNPKFNSQIDHEAFYVNSAPTAIFDSDAVAKYLTIYVPGDLYSVYEQLFPLARHALIGTGYPSHP